MDLAPLLSVLDGIKVDANQLIPQLTETVEKLTEDTNAVVYNATDDDVEFRCYNDSDELRWIPARHPKCAPASYTYVNKGPLGWGPTIQIWVGKTNGPYYVLRQHGYIWDGNAFWEKDDVAKALEEVA